jgi:hypothetical protein
MTEGIQFCAFLHAWAPYARWSVTSVHFSAVANPLSVQQTLLCGNGCSRPCSLPSCRPACRSHVTLTQLVGYSIALSGVCAYNYSKMHSKAQQGASKPPGRPGATPDFPASVKSHRVSVSSTASDDSMQWDAAVAVDESARPLLGTIKAGEPRSFQQAGMDDTGCALRLSPKVGVRGQSQSSGTPKFWPLTGAGERNV